jgi:HSP20 family protein
MSMTNLAIRSPFSDLLPLSTTMNRLFEDSFLTPRLASLWQPQYPMDIYETDDEIVVRATLSGFRPDDVKISVLDNQLTIEGKAASYQMPENARCLLHEMGGDAEFQRKVTLPSSVVSDKAQARFEHGVLTLTLPKAETAKPKQIAIKVS